MKKVLILTVTAGNGHNACAKAMKQKLEQEEGVEVRIVDLLKSYSSSFDVWMADKGYNIAIGKFRHMYNFFYNYYYNQSPSKRYRCKAQASAMSTVCGLLREIYTYQPDVIYCVHFYGAIALTDLKLAYNVPCKTIVANLDYVNSPFWEGGIGVDYFIVPNEDFIDPTLKIGFKSEQIKPLGLPVNEKFYFELDKIKTREKLGLDKDVFTIMVMFGGGHWGGGYKIFNDLIHCLSGRKAQVIMINGRNQRDFDRIARKKFEDNIRVLNVGFTNEVDLYMSASDVILNKLGGTSATEMINKKLPIIVTDKVSGQERYNLNYLKSKGVAKSFKNKRELKKIIFDLMDNREHLEQMVENSSKLRRNGIDNLAKFILSQPNAEYDQNEIESIDYDMVFKTVQKARIRADKLERQNQKRLKRTKPLAKVES